MHPHIHAASRPVTTRLSCAAWNVLCFGFAYPFHPRTMQYKTNFCGLTAMDDAALLQQGKNESRNPAYGKDILTLPTTTRAHTQHHHHHHHTHRHTTTTTTHRDTPPHAHTHTTARACARLCSTSLLFCGSANVPLPHPPFFLGGGGGGGGFPLKFTRTPAQSPPTTHDTRHTHTRHHFCHYALPPHHSREPLACPCCPMDAGMNDPF